MLDKRSKEYVFAKTAITLDKLFELEDQFQINKIIDLHSLYKESLLKETLNFNYNFLDKYSKGYLSKILETHSIFYSFCFNYYTYIPACICSMNYNLIVLVSENILSQDLQIINNIEKNIRKQNNILGEIEFWPNKTPNLLLKLKIEISRGKKVLIFADGNKDSLKASDKNIFFGHLKNKKIHFQQGFSYLNFLLKKEKIIGIIPKEEEKSFSLDFIQNDIDINLSLKEYTKIATNAIIQNLNNLLKIENIHLWNNFLSVHNWFIVSEEDKTDIHIPFLIGKNYYAMEYGTFYIYQISKKDYLALK